MSAMATAPEIIVRVEDIEPFMSWIREVNEKAAYALATMPGHPSRDAAVSALIRTCLRFQPRKEEEEP